MTLLNIALIAQDTRRDALVQWAERHRALLSGHRIVATGDTGGRLKEAIPELKVERLLGASQGGTLQVGARLAEGRIDALVCLVDPDRAEPDTAALLRLAILRNVPLALNLATAEALVTLWPKVVVLAGAESA
ncbi:methylglyoxal synthase [Roseomonas sp. BN140053]|uniref:methylglyoxal synthase n=1 Tax=Roseomonas sp. BN140053 TaxID=3391898 RepID=UPI0039ED4355